MFNRIVLISFIFGIWLAVKVLDCLVHGPVLLIALFLILTLAIIHSIWMLAAQRRWRRKQRKLKGLTEQFSVILEPENNAPLVDPDEEVWEPTVDILISAKNEGRVIESTVRNFFKLDYAKFSLWIINDNSTDDMPQILDKLKGEFANLNVIHRQPGSYPGKSAALNEALPLCKGEVIAVFDADAYVGPNFLKLTLPVLNAEHVGAVQVQKKLFVRQRTFLEECQANEYAVDTYFQTGRDLIGGLVELRGNGQLIKRQALVDVGGWNNRSITDDLDLTMRLAISKWDIRFCPYAVVYEEAVPTLKALIRQRRRWAEGSIRRYLDYIFQMNAPSRLSIVERIDILAFVCEFTVPGLICLEVISEAIGYFSGAPLHPRLLLTVFVGLTLVSQFNFFSAFRLYRPDLSTWKALIETGELSAYALPLWLPCVSWSIWQIIVRKQASTWHPTEHFGGAAKTEASV